MKTLLILAILVFPFNTFAQSTEWKAIKEMSGEIPDNPGLTIETYASEIARGGDVVKLVMRFDFPAGAPFSIFRDAVPRGFDVSSIDRFQGRIELNCETLVVTPNKSTGEVFQFNGKRLKSKEPPFKIESGHILAQYFCEQGEAPTKAPTLKKP